MKHKQFISVKDHASLKNHALTCAISNFPWTDSSWPWTFPAKSRKKTSDSGESLVKKVIRVFEVVSNKVADLVFYTFSAIYHSLRWYQAGSKYWWKHQGLDGFGGFDFSGQQTKQFLYMPKVKACLGGWSPQHRWVWALVGIGLPGVFNLGRLGFV